MDRSLHPPLLQNPACDFHRTRLLSDAPLGMGIRRARPSARQTCDLSFGAFPYQGIAPSRLRAGSSACTALHTSVTCTSPSSRQPIRGVTLGLRFLRNPSPYALRLAPTPMVSESTYEVTPFPVLIARVLRAVLSTGFVGSAYRSVNPAAGALSYAILAPARPPRALGRFDDGSSHLRLRCP